MHTEIGLTFFTDTLLVLITINFGKKNANSSREMSASVAIESTESSSINNGISLHKNSCWRMTHTNDVVQDEESIPLNHHVTVYSRACAHKRLWTSSSRTCNDRLQSWDMIMKKAVLIHHLFGGVRFFFSLSPMAYKSFTPSLAVFFSFYPFISTESFVPLFFLINQFIQWCWKKKWTFSLSFFILFSVLRLTFLISFYIYFDFYFLSLSFLCKMEFWYCNLVWHRVAYIKHSVRIKLTKSRNGRLEKLGKN